MQQTARHTRLRPIALPVEHGGWALVRSTILLGLLLTFSNAGVLMGFGAVFLFLFRHPFRLAVNDIRRRKVYLRTQWAAAIGAGYLCVAVAAFALAWTASPTFLAPIVLLLFFGSVQFVVELSGHGRTILAESFGAIALSSIACAIVLVGRGDTTSAWTAWLILSLQSVTAIAYVRARLKLSRGAAVNRVLPIALQVLALAVVSSIVVDRRSGIALLAVFAWLILRTMWGLSNKRRDVRPAIVCLQETGFSLAVVFATAWTLRA